MARSSRQCGKSEAHRGGGRLSVLTNRNRVLLKGYPGSETRPPRWTTAAQFTSAPRPGGWNLAEIVFRLPVLLARHSKLHRVTGTSAFSADVHDSGMLDVGDGNLVYWEVRGNS